MLLGRCNACGSLRNDCGSCDFWIEEEQVRVSRTLAKATEDSLLLATHNEDDDDGNINDKSSSSSDNEEFEKVQQQNRRRYRKYLRMKALAKPYFDDSSSDGSSNKGGHKEGGHKEQENATDDCSDSEDDLPLHQLALQASQREPPVHSRRRLLASPLRNSSKQTRHHRPKGPRSRRMERSVLEDLPEPGPNETTSRSRVSFVRSPGLEDLSDSTSSSRGEPPPRAPVSAQEAEIEASATEFENEDDIVLPDSTQDGFIQPEGNAEELPDDIRDRTQHLKYSELAPFFDRIAVQLENDWIPDFKLRLAILEAQCKKSFTSDVKEELFKERYVKL
jgi:hypothetical protein